VYRILTNTTDYLGVMMRGRIRCGRGSGIITINNLKTWSFCKKYLIMPHRVSLDEISVFDKMKSTSH